MAPIPIANCGVENPNARFWPFDDVALAVAEVEPAAVGPWGVVVALCMDVPDVTIILEAIDEIVSGVVIMESLDIGAVLKLPSTDVRWQRLNWLQHLITQISPFFQVRQKLCPDYGLLTSSSKAEDELINAMANARMLRHGVNERMLARYKQSR